MASCTSPFSLRPGDRHAQASSSGSDNQSSDVRKRRPSYSTARRKSLVAQIMEGEDALILKVDLFLSELERRLDFLESYSDLGVDSTVSRAYATLQTVRTRCSEVSGEMIGEGRRRLYVMIETLESRYQGAMETADSLSDKARVSIELLDGMLSDFESQASKLRERGLQNVADAAELVVGEGKRVVDEGLERARSAVEEGLRGAKHAAETLEDAIQNAMTRAKEHGLIRYDDLPMPWRINPHIRKGYRFTESYWGCVRSAFGVSNELINIWTHAVGLLLVIALAFYFYPTSLNFHLSTTADICIAAVFFFAACQCLICSTIWHTFNSIGDVKLVSTFACIDYTGISLLIAASIMTSEYTAFYCEPISRWAYLTTTAILGVGGVVLPWSPTFNRADMAWARVVFYMGLGATGFLPMLQLSLSRGPEYVAAFYSPIGKSLFVYVAGAFIYASKIPERWCPGMFDYIGGSHNLWHIAVLGGIMFHYSAMQEFFSDAFRRAEGGCPAY